MAKVIPPEILLLGTTLDPASVGIRQALEAAAPWVSTEVLIEGEPIRVLEGMPEIGLLNTHRLHLEAEPVETALHAAGIEPRAIVFLSKHKAASGKRALTVHPVGNYGTALYGGQAHRLGPCDPALQSELLRGLLRRARAESYPAEVAFEVTHHGPLLKTPSCFIELGSGPEHWGDPVGARIVAQTIIDVVTKPLPDYPRAVGLGGGHYAPRFTEAALSQRVHFGHLIPNHAAEVVPDPAAMALHAVEASPGAGGVYLHRKSLPRDVLERWRGALQAAGIRMLDSGEWQPLESTGVKAT